MALFILGLKKCEASGIHVNEPLLNPIQDGSFWGCSRMGGRGGKKVTLPKVCDTYPILKKLGKVIGCLEKTQIIYESRDTPLEFC